jgi:exodeoxyribonuclease III
MTSHGVQRVVRLIIKPAQVPQTNYNIVSWNVNGYRDNIHAWLLDYVAQHAPDVIFLSETKKSEDFLRVKFAEFPNYNVIINNHNPCRWHGVAMLIRKNNTYQHIPITMNIAVRNDNKGVEAADGRIIAIVLNNQMYVIGSYTPNSGRGDDHKLTYRVRTWDTAFTTLLEMSRKAGPTVWIGDINVALDDIDVSNPKGMKNYAGFRPQERHNLRQLLTNGEWIDIWRHQHPEQRMYTWRGTADPNVYGMRLDNIILSQDLLPLVQQSYMITNCPLAADHIPVCVQLLRN